MSYQILAQKYRPRTFDEIVGQEVIARTLRNSIERGRVANAYIFCGPRGVGKTSVARLVAKMLNCAEPSADGPCNKCTSCLEITSSNSMDVLEIDGASNRGIDEIRALRENVKFSPTRGKYKVYIIDEVHMLTQEAFNALLKTLEEPPRHVKFIFATTEAHKVLPTIMSRCQRFDFRRISPGKIFERIMAIALKEKIDIDEKAALLISRGADGSLRDAIVVLDQMASYTDKRITQDDVVDLLGMLGRDKVHELSGAIIDKDVKTVAILLDGLIDGGKDPVFIANSLLGYYRDLLMLKASGQPTSDMAFTEEELAEMKAQNERLSVEEILYILQNISSCLYQMKGTTFTRAPLEIGLLRMARRGNVLSIPAIMDRLEKLGGKGPDFTSGRADQAAGMRGPSHAKSAGTPGGTSMRPSPLSGTGQDDRDNDGPDNPSIKAERVQWETVLKNIKDRKMSVFTFLNEGKPVEFNPERVVIGFSQDRAFNIEVLETESSKAVVKEALTSVLGKTPAVEFRMLEFLGGSAKDRTESERERSQAREKLKPVIEKAMDIFGGQVLRDLPGGAR